MSKTSLRSSSRAGGVDFGGDTETQLHNALLLARFSKAATYARYGVPVIYAGNQDVRHEIERLSLRRPREWTSASHPT